MAFEDDATTRCGSRGFAEIVEKLGFRHDLVDARRLLNGLLGKLDDGTRLDRSGRADVVTHTGGHWAKRASLIVPVRLDDADGDFGSHLDDEASQADDFLWA